MLAIFIQASFNSWSSMDRPKNAKAVATKSVMSALAAICSCRHTSNTSILLTVDVCWIDTGNAIGTVMVVCSGDHNTPRCQHKIVTIFAISLVYTHHQLVLYC